MGTFIQTNSLLLYGLSSLPVRVECTVSRGLPSITIIGSASHVLIEAKDRVRSAILHSGLDYPRQRITINLAPADVPKQSTSLDLAIALAILLSGNNQPLKTLDKLVILGELSLDGNVRSVRGIIGHLRHLAKDVTIMLPADNMAQALGTSNSKLLPVRTLKEAFDFCLHGSVPVIPQPSKKPAEGPITLPPATIYGQETAKRALTISAAGGHNVLLYGPPGAGKTLLASMLPSLLPPPTRDELLTVSHIHSLVAQNYNHLVPSRPFRKPHHNASHTAMIGGGSTIRPGEISLSHGGVLLLDELPEFDRRTIEALRQPLEEHVITITRTAGSVTLPADFLLVATANPCPCGFYGSDKACSCSASQISRYRQKLSGPILDRIDLHVAVQPVEHNKLLEDADFNYDDHVQHIQTAQHMQRKRYGRRVLNGRINDHLLTQHMGLTAEARLLLETAAKKLQLSARSFVKILRIGRTIADLEGSHDILTPHIAEALQYRTTL